MGLKEINEKKFQEGDLVTIRSTGENHPFCIIGFRINDRGERTAILKGLFHQSYIVEKPVTELTSLLLKGKL